MKPNLIKTILIGSVIALFAIVITAIYFSKFPKTEPIDNNKPISPTLTPAISLTPTFTPINNVSSNGFLIVKHDYQMPYGSTPDLFYIFDSSNNYIKPVITVRTNITADDRGSNLSYQLVGNKVYFFDNKDRVVKWVDFEGNIYPLEFTKSNNLWYSNYFLVSSDNKKIVWVDGAFHSDDINKTVKTTSKIMMANIDGSNKKVLLEKNFDVERTIRLIQWSNSDKEVYYYTDPVGIGGYIIFSGYWNLSKINIDTGKTEDITGKNKFTGNLNYISDISSDEKKLAYFTQIDEEPKFGVKDIESGQDNIVDIPLAEGFKGGGDAHFSPDNKHVVYDIAHGNPDDEYYRKIVVDSDGKNQKTIIDDPKKAYWTERWLSNDKIIVGYLYDYYLVNIDGTGLSKLPLGD